MRESLHMVLFQSSSFIEDGASESLLNNKVDISGYYLGRGLCPTLRGVDRKLGGWRSTFQGAQQEIEELDSHLFKKDIATIQVQSIPAFSGSVELAITSRGLAGLRYRQGTASIQYQSVLD